MATGGASAPLDSHFRPPGEIGQGWPARAIHEALDKFPPVGYPFTRERSRDTKRAPATVGPFAVGGSARAGGIGRQQEHKAGLGWRADPPDAKGPTARGRFGRPAAPCAPKGRHGDHVALAGGSIVPPVGAAGELFPGNVASATPPTLTTYPLRLDCPHEQGDARGAQP